MAMPVKDHPGCRRQGTAMDATGQHQQGRRGIAGSPATVHPWRRAADRKLASAKHSASDFHRRLRLRSSPPVRVDAGGRADAANARLNMNWTTQAWMDDGSLRPPSGE